MKLVVALHDVTPFHLPRLVRAEALFRELGIAKATYLFVPAYHGQEPADRDPAFVAWCRAERPFRIDWQLHGYYHREDPNAAAQGGSLSDRLKRRFLTAGEGEFLALDAAEQRQRLERGREIFRRCLEREPEGFVAPAWLFNAALAPTLRELGFRLTEDFRRVVAIDRGRDVASPVVTWATRTWLRKYGSLATAPLVARFAAGAPVLRVAVHPFDLDHAVTVKSIRRVLGGLLAARTQALCGELDFGDARPELSPSEAEALV
jgi:predicted deacetylase